MPQKPDAAIPDWATTAIERLVSVRKASRLREDATALTAAYRASDRTKPGAIDVPAYLAMRAPATHAAMMQALSALQAVLPDFEPRSLLDIGAGPGTASWAAVSRYPSIAQAVLIERASSMRDAGKVIAAHAPHAVLSDAHWLAEDATQPEFRPADLALSAYVLNELSSAKATELAARMFSAAGIVVLVEPGSRAGFERLRAVRTQLIAQGGVILAPCTHEKPCPIAGNDWCHFSVRVQRSRLHRQAKGANLSHEDEKFAYLIAAKPEAAISRVLPQARIIRQPMARKGHVHLDLCADGRLYRHTVTRSDDAYGDARDAAWGDAWAD